MTEQAPIYTPSLEAIQRAEPDLILSAFIGRFNDMTAQLDDQETIIALQNQKREADGRLIAQHREEIKQLTAERDELAREQQSCRDLALEAEQIANKSLTTEAELHKLRLAHKQLQADYTKLKQGDSPERLRKQLANSKAKAQEKQQMLDAQKKISKELRQDKKQLELQLNKSVNLVRELKQQLAHDTGSGLYHEGDHHLIVWPQVITTLRDDGERSTGRALLYMHQSGRGALITHYADKGPQMAAAPKGGLRPSAKVLEFAENWLFKVNELQGGTAHADDMIPVDYNKKPV